ncbi:tRNA methyltransferase 2 [Binucleata daphniae]
MLIGIENNEESIKILEENIKINNVTNYVPKKSDVEKEMFYEKSSVILDPPRCGVSKKTIQNIRRNENIKEIFYVSCNYKLSYQNILDLCKEETNAYKNSKFTIKTVDAFDMFPFTTNIEILIHLTRD